MRFNEARRDEAPFEIDGLRVCWDGWRDGCDFSSVQTDIEKLSGSVRQICPLQYQVHEVTMCEIARVKCKTGSRQGARAKTIVATLSTGP